MSENKGKCPLLLGMTRTGGFDISLSLPAYVIISKTPTLLQMCRGLFSCHFLYNFIQTVTDLLTSIKDKLK